jgi:hypothetical protein
MIYLELLKALEENRIHYVIVGGLAVILHGFARMSIDLDLAVSLDASNVRHFLNVVKELGYRSRLPVPLEDFADPEKRKIWIEQKNMLVFSLVHEKRVQELIDVFVQDIVPFEELYVRHVSISLGSIRAKVASIQDLKKMKQLAGRPQDIQDIAALNEIERRRNK